MGTFGMRLVLFAIFSTKLLPFLYLYARAINRSQTHVCLLFMGFISYAAHASEDLSSNNQQAARSTIKPLIESRCMVCHGCYDAPCQLKMESFEGLSRGANKALVYDGARLTEAPLTRLYEDANSQEAWQKKGFYSVLDAPQNDPMTSLMARMLTLKKAHPLPTEKILPDSFDFRLQRDQQCPAPDEFEQFAKKKPLWGMPYGLPALNEQEHSLLIEWIQNGSPYTQPSLTTEHLLPFIDLWEEFFNRDSLKNQLVSRYLFEHLYLANLYFEDEGTQTVYYKLVRSATPPGQPIQRIATRRPFDAPSVKRVYYRLWQSPDSLLAKTHMPYALNAQRMNFWTSLFFASDYEVSELPGYEPAVAANPFITFQQLPPESRYRFLLEEAEFTIMNYIKGSVCRGTVALNVIQDRFWVLFAEPGQFDSNESAHFLASQDKHLQMPASSQSGLLSITDWLSYADAQKSYLKAKSVFMKKHIQSMQNKGIDIIWDGDKSNTNAALTVFRHHNSASVVKGLVGTSPKTIWVIDYPILERIHYLLVAGFDVYGSVSHQAMTRMYMDFLRMESEMNYLSLLPEATRREKVEFWYRDAIDDIQPYLDLYIKAGVPGIVRNSETVNATQQLEKSLRVHLDNALTPYYSLKASSLSKEAITALSRLSELTGTPATLLPESTLITVEGKGVLSLLADTAYSNISSMFDEKERRLPNEDKLTIATGFISAYPNVILSVPEKNIPDMVKSIELLKSEHDYEQFLDQYGVRRSDPNFWNRSDKILEKYRAKEPLNSGILDYNRLDNR